MSKKSKFNTNKYGLMTGEVHNTNRTARPGVPMYPFSDGSDDLANIKSSIIGVKHIPSQQSVFFKAFITQYNENFDSEWERTTVMGRPDPLLQFRNTQRSISIGWNIPAASLGEGVENLQKVQELIRFLYPSYNTVSGLDVSDEIRFNALGIASPPLVRLKFMNMITKTERGSNTVSIGTSADNRGPGAAPNSTRPGRVTFDGDNSDTGMLGFISNVTINHNVEGDAGVFHGVGAIVPKLIEVVIDFNPIHEDKLGWNMSTDPTKRNQSGDIPRGFSEFQTQANGQPAGSTSVSSFPYGLGNEFDPSLQAETLDAMQRAQAERLAILQCRADKEAAQQIAQVRHSGFLGGVFKRADAKYYRRRMLDPSLNRDPYRMAAGSVAADREYPDTSVDRSADRAALLKEARRNQDKGRGGPK